MHQGNDLFRQGKYKEAAEMYNSAVDVDGTQPVYMSNLAATYLKLEECAGPLHERKCPQIFLTSVIQQLRNGSKGCLDGTDSRPSNGKGSFSAGFGSQRD
jgi:hypothetical protein